VYDMYPWDSASPEGRHPETGASPDTLPGAIKAVQIALEDPQVPPQRTYDLAMRFAAGQLGFDWEPAPAAKRARKRGS